MNLENIQKEVVALSLECGAFMQKEAESFDYSKVELKGKNDLVSYVDKELEIMIANRLKKVLPEAGFITEEGTQQIDNNPLKWVIDPLDGTTNFIHGLPVYCTSIALIDANELLVGVVYEPSRNECFHARKGGGAFCNDKRIHVSKLNKISDSLLATGFPFYDFEKIGNYVKILNELMQNAHGLRRLGSAAVDLAYVAIGRYEAYFEYNLNAWDLAAGALIVQEAGGTVTDFSGGDNFVFGRELVAANSIHTEMIEVIKKYW
ncbi:inositol monophosphatase family protein [Reichenbachiella sp. MALMAid0571]|uniref:inositol monophosphatase family protein n=1 Tax=Reichenbachiella sp. MALMAid0571 TaxID=3143939 RepID=UPI0032DE4785